MTSHGWIIPPQSTKRSIFRVASDYLLWMPPKLLLAALALATALPAVANAQVTSLDEGSFSLSRDGELTGHENFSIRSTPGARDRVIIARATVLTGTRRVDPILSADSSGFPVAYQSQVKVDGHEVQRYSGSTTGTHYASRAQIPDGESAREFRLLPGTVAVDDEIVHHLWFIARRGVGAVVPVLVPNRNVLEQVRVEGVGLERLRVDTRDLEVTHLRLVTLGTNVTRDVWLDTDGRLVKAKIPALRLDAVRDDR